MDLNGQWQVREDLEPLTSDLTAGQPFLGKNQKKKEEFASVLLTAV